MENVYSMAGKIASPERVGVDCLANSSRKPRVLVLDDDPIYCLKLSSFLMVNLVSHHLRTEVLANHTAEELSTYDALVLDWYLSPDKNAGQIIRDLKAKKIDIPIVIVSQSIPTEIMRDWLQDRQIKFVQKTKGVEEVYRAINSFV